MSSVENTTDLVTVLGGGFCAIGAGLSVVAGRFFARRLAFVRSSDVAPGEVVALREERDGSETQRFRFPKVRFRTAAGHAFTFESGMGLGGNAWQVGETVRVRYQLDRPEIAEVDGFTSLWGPTLLFALLAAAFLFIGIGLWIRVIPV